jgi:DNA-binding NarL/FixJ family response regulator
MLTGHTQRSRVVAAKEAGVSGFMAKPISARALARRLMTAIGAHPSFKPRPTSGPTLPGTDEDENTYLL